MASFAFVTHPNRFPTARFVLIAGIGLTTVCSSCGDTGGQGLRAQQVASVGGSPQAASAGGPVFRLPASAKTLVALTYDDGDQTQLTNAVPQLDARGLRGTFFLNAVGGSYFAAQWQAVAAAGHELGNHTLYHPCPLSGGGRAGFTTEEYTLARYETDVVTQDGLLDVIDGQTSGGRAFAFPCSRHTVDEGDVSVLPFLSASPLVDVARTGEVDYSPFIAPDKDYDAVLLPSYMVPNNTPAATVIAQLDKAHETKAALVCTFHQIGGDYATMSPGEHEKLLDYLVANSARFEVVPFGPLARRGLGAQE